MLKLIVFDWDGTLADSIQKIIECKIFLANKYNLPIPDEELIRSVIGIKFEEALAKCFPDASFSLLEKLGKEFHLLMQEDCYQARLFPGTQNMLLHLKNREIKLAIATSKDRKEIDKAIYYNNLSSFFDVVCCGKEHEEKPHPSMMNFILKELTIKADEALMVGDTITDIMFAKNANVKNVSVAFGAHPKSLLASLDPIALIDKWTQLQEVVNKLC